MNESIRKYIYIFITVCVLIVVGKLFLKALPWMIAIGVVIYLTSKVKGYINNKNNNQSSSNNTNNVYENNTDDYSNGEVIDVDYEDIDKK